MTSVDWIAIGCRHGRSLPVMSQRLGVAASLRLLDELTFELPTGFEPIFAKGQ